MDISSFLEAAFPSRDRRNSSDASPIGLAGFSPTTLLETFVPGYGPVHKFILHSFGFDVTILVSLGACLWLSVRTYQYIYHKVYSLISDHYMSQITIEPKDEIYYHLLKFLALLYKIKSWRRLTARTLRSWEVEEDAESEPTETTVDAEGNMKWLNFSGERTKSQPRFTPATGSHDFWYKGTYFQVKRYQKKMPDRYGELKEREILTICCFGRSTDPIKALIHDAKADYYKSDKEEKETVIHRPSSSGKGYWSTIATRPCRPMKTVVLDEESKMGLLVDINEYLHPATGRWYSNRGIPYRRGYLLHGPPGTGKTSLTFALAGVFGLDIYVVSLLDSSITEEELGYLFRNLPSKCIVLLEDIDTAGLDRKLDTEDEKEVAPEAKDKKANNEANVVEALTKAITKASQKSEPESKKGKISLSALLNIIDGVASHEGRVLIMTTNHPEKLDEALIRPGRIDHQVAFTNATQHQVKELFERMYTHDLPRTTKIPSSTSSPPASSAPPPPYSSGASTPIISGNNELPPTENENLPAPPPTPPIEATVNGVVKDGKGGKEEWTEEELIDIAKKFAAQVPDDMFSPAEIQGFLLKRKREPRRALEEVGSWVEEMRSVKVKGASKEEADSVQEEKKVEVLEWMWSRVLVTRVACMFGLF